MKNTKRKLSFLALTLGALALAACNDSKGGESGGSDKKCPPHVYGDWVVETEPTELNDGVSKKTCTICGTKTITEVIPAIGFERNVVIKDASGNEIVNKTVRSKQKIEKPEDPVAPEGKQFLGWKNVKNGGQMWDFEDDILGLAAYDVELVPVFIDAGLEPQYLEGELCKEICASTNPWSGSTYSGGAEGKQMIGKDDGYELGASCQVGEFKYYREGTKCIAGEAPEGKTQLTYNPLEENAGFYVHFNYTYGNTFEWNIECSEDVENVTILARYSGEYGFEDSTTFAKTISFNDDEYLITVNDEKLSYGTVTLTNIPVVGSFLPFQDYLVSTTVSLKAGSNTIKMKVNNKKDVFGTIHATAPAFDCLKIYTSATITWNDVDYANLVK